MIMKFRTGIIRMMDRYKMKWVPFSCIRFCSNFFIILQSQTKSTLSIIKLQSLHRNNITGTGRDRNSAIYVNISSISLWSKHHKKRLCLMILTISFPFRATSKSVNYITDILTTRIHFVVTNVMAYHSYDRTKSLYNDI